MSHITIIIPTYNPNIIRLNRTIQGIINQSVTNWECIIINNNSTQLFETEIIKHPQLKVVQQPKQGLTYARLKGFEEAKGDIIIMVDDDNVLEKNYLKHCLDIFEQHPNLGAIGGNISPEFETIPPQWTEEFWGKLAIRNLGDKVIISENNAATKSQIINHKSKIQTYPLCAPVGAGMAIKTLALKKYINQIQSQQTAISDRSGNSLTSSGDNEIVMQILLSNYQVGFFPQLNLIHLVPANRLTKKYLAKLNEGIMQSWSQFLLKYKICPWPTFAKYTLILRILKAYFTYKPWQSNTQYVVYKGIVGQLKGLSK